MLGETLWLDGGCNLCHSGLDQGRATREEGHSGETLILRVPTCFSCLKDACLPLREFPIPSVTCTCTYMWVKLYNVSPPHSPWPQALNPGREMKLEDLEGDWGLWSC